VSERRLARLRGLVPLEDGQEGPDPVGPPGSPEVSERRLARLRGAWERTVHHAVHPISALMVLAAAGVEVVDWLGHGIELAMRWIEATRP
jgi:hypothetical protein